jgi:hypothetical protein
MSNFNINCGGREGKEIPHDVTLKTADIGEGSTYSEGDTFSFAFNEHEVPFSSKKGEEPTVEQYLGKQKGLKDIAKQLGHWKDGMTGDGKVVKEKWLRGDLVIIRMLVGDSDQEELQLHRVHKVPKAHMKCDDSELISVKMLTAISGKSNAYAYGKDTKTYDYLGGLLTWIDPAKVKVIGGKQTGLSGLKVQVDLQKVMDAYGNDESDTEEADDTSLRSVLGALPMFKEERSRVVTMIEDRTDRFGNMFGHVCNFSSKHHCEVAGQGIEYDNGRSKWWYRSHCDETVGGMRKNAALSVSKSVITLVHSMKFARKARDFMRAYRTGSMGKDVEKHSREFRAHRCMLNCFFTFVSED